MNDREKNMQQGNLFDHKPPPARYPAGPGHTNDTTSKAAAASIRPHVNYQQGRILGWLAKAPDGGIYTVIALGCELREQSVCGRMRELVEAKLVSVKDGETRPTDSGRQAQVYRITEAGRDAVPEERR